MAVVLLRTSPPSAAQGEPGMIVAGEAREQRRRNGFDGFPGYLAAGVARRAGGPRSLPATKLALGPFSGENRCGSKGMVRLRTLRWRRFPRVLPLFLAAAVAAAGRAGADDAPDYPYPYPGPFKTTEDLRWESPGAGSAHLILAGGDPRDGKIRP